MCYLPHGASLALLLSCLTTPAYADPATACDAAARRAAEEAGVPEPVMLAIARVESGRSQTPWPWTVNHAGEGHWFKTEREALDFAEARIAEGESNLDIGCFQVNLRWHGENFTGLEAMFDPEENARYAAHFLGRLHASEGNWVNAVAAYHSRTPAHAEAYVEKVEAVLLALGEEPAVAPQPALTNSFPLLKQGATGRMGSLVAPAGTLRPMIGGP